ncbi:hypothetical protein M271_50445 [Streptomyces rapamycinicus NRRL 5491]|nr:hypothetical protein M271_50445 [Streptomyces rapamycinicus NRRL 5491]
MNAFTTRFAFTMDSCTARCPQFTMISGLAAPCMKTSGSSPV